MTRLMVYVRVKPLLDQARSIIDVIDDKSLIFDPRDEENEPNNEYFYKGRTFSSIGVRQNKNSRYEFDHVFGTNATNYEIFETVTKPMVDATVDGINCSVFAYGATGSGKTFTMLGAGHHPGVIYHTSKELFQRIEHINQQDPLQAELKVCYFEIYNEKIRDLLFFENFIKMGNKRLRTTPERNQYRQKLVARDVYNLPIMDASNGGSVIPDLSYHSPTNADELIELLEIGNRQRSQHPTEANADSSRSHAIFQIVLVRRTRCIRESMSDLPEYELQNSKLSLIDLAGSERASVAYKAGAERSKNLQREGGNINKSLLALGNCINALANPRANRGHIPYRNSKLTRLLRDSLEGKCRTAMIATVCQQASHYDDTQNTLAYANRSKCIKLKPGRNCNGIVANPRNYTAIIKNQNQTIEMYEREIQRLKQENDELRRQQHQQQQANKSNNELQEQHRKKPNLNTTFQKETPPLPQTQPNHDDEKKLSEMKDTLSFIAAEANYIYSIINVRNEFSMSFKERVERLVRTAEGKRQNGKKVKWVDQPAGENIDTKPLATFNTQLSEEA